LNCNLYVCPVIIYVYLESVEAYTRRTRVLYGGVCIHLYTYLSFLTNSLSLFLFLFLSLMSTHAFVGNASKGSSKVMNS
jgi:hypothetical protein